MQMRQKALIIMGFETPDRKLSRVERGWNNHALKNGEEDIKIRSSTSMDFLIARDKSNKRPGFIEVEMQPGESPMDALRRLNPLSASAVTRPWQKVDSFPYKEHDNLWGVQVGLVLVHADQRAVDLYEQSDELPYLLEWQTPGWLFRQQQEDIFNLLTSTALTRPLVREFLIATQRAYAS